MEDYIFLIIAVLISIFAAIKKKEKKEIAKPLVNEPEKSRNYLLDQILGDDFLDEADEDNDTPDWRNPIPAREPMVVSKLAKPEIFHTEIQSHLPERSNSKIQLSVKRQMLEEEVESESENSPGYLEDFSLRKAFVYSEIMERKY